MVCNERRRKIPDSKLTDIPDSKLTDPDFVESIEPRIAAIVKQLPKDPFRVSRAELGSSGKTDEVKAGHMAALDPANIKETARRLVRCEIALESAERQLADMRISHLQSAMRESRHLKDHIESNFEPGMTWDNRGSWVIDFHTPIEEVSPNDVDATMWDIIRRLRPCNLKPVWNTNHCGQCYQRIDK